MADSVGREQAENTVSFLFTEMKHSGVRERKRLKVN